MTMAIMSQNLSKHLYNLFVFVLNFEILNFETVQDLSRSRIE